MTVVMALVLGLFGDVSGLVDKHYLRIVDPADLPDMKRLSEPSSLGDRMVYFETADYGWRPGGDFARGKEKVAAVIHRLGPPMRLERYSTVERGWMWRHRRPDRPHAGIMIVIDERFGTVKLQSWGEMDRSRGYTGRIGVEGEDEIYRWFAWLTTPLTPTEAASPPALAPMPGGDVRR